MPNTPRERVAWIVVGVLLLLLLWCAFGSYLNLPTFASLTAGTLESEEATPSAVKESASQVPAVQRPVSNTIAITPTPKPSVAVAPAPVLPFAANLLAVAGDTSVTLSWSVPLSLNPVSHYVVSRSTSPAQGSLIATTPVPFYIDSSVSNDTTYYYQVQAVDSKGSTGPMSNQASATPRLFVTVPSSPSNLVATGGINHIALAWSSPASSGGGQVSEYRIYRGFSFDAIGFYSSTQNPWYSDFSVTPGVTYYYKIYAVNRAGTSLPSNTSSATPTQQQQQTVSPVYYQPSVQQIPIVISSPAPPVYYAPPASYQNPGQVSTLRVTREGDARVELGWSYPSQGTNPITGFQIFRGISSDALGYVNTVSGASYADASVINGTTYYYQVRAVDSQGSPGEKSNRVSATPSSLLQAPSEVTGLAGELRAPVIHISWVAPRVGDVISSYRIYRGVNSANDAFYQSVSSLAFDDANVAAGNTYYYRVEAVGVMGVGPKSNQITVSYPALVPPVPPVPPVLSVQPPGTITNIYASPVNPTDGRSTITWSGTGDIASYNLWKSINSGGETLVLSGSATQYFDSGLVAGNIYQYRAQAVSSASVRGAYSEYVTVIPQYSLPPSLPTPPVPPVPPAPIPAPVSPAPVPSVPPTPPPAVQIPSQVINVSATHARNGVITVSWSPVSGATGYSVYRGGMFAGNAFGTTHDDGSWDAWNASYSYQVSARNSAGEGARSNSVSVFGGICGGLSSGATCGMPVYSSNGKAKTIYACGQDRCVGSWKWVDGTSEQESSDTGGIFCKSGQSWVSGSWLGKIADWYVSNACQ